MNLFLLHQGACFCQWPSTEAAVRQSLSTRKGDQIEAKSIVSRICFSTEHVGVRRLHSKVPSPWVKDCPLPSSHPRLPLGPLRALLLQSTFSDCAFLSSEAWLDSLSPGNILLACFQGLGLFQGSPHPSPQIPPNTHPHAILFPWPHAPSAHSAHPGIQPSTPRIQATSWPITAICK